VIDYQTNQLYQNLKLWQSIAMQKQFWDFLDSTQSAKATFLKEFIIKRWL